MGADQKFGLMVEMKSDIKKFQSGMDTAKVSTKQFSGAFKGVMGQATSQFGAFGGVIGRGSGILKSMIPVIHSIKAALISSGIGAILVAVGVAIAAVRANINRTVEGKQKWKVFWAGMSGAMDVFKDRLADLGKAIFKFLSWDFKGAWQEAKEAIKGVGTEVKKEYEEARALQERENKLWKANLDLRKEDSKALAQINELRRKGEERSKYTAEERQKFLKQAGDIETRTANLRVANAKEELAIQQERMAMGHDSMEDKEKEVELIVAVNNLLAESDKKLRSILAKEEAITKEIETQEKALRKALETSLKLANTVIDLGEEMIKMEDIDISIDPIVIDDIAKSLSTATYLTAKWREELALLQEQGPTLGQVLHASIASNIETLSDSLIQGAANFKEYGRSMAAAAKDIIGSQMAQATAALVSRAIQDAALTPIVGLFLAPILAAAAGGIVRTAFNSLIPDFAAGGLAYSNTIARVGEYPGARNNPEVIAPLNKLKDMIGIGGEVIFRQEGAELVGVLKAYDNRNKLFN